MHLLIYYNMGSKSAIGIGNGICFKQVRDKGGGSYIDPLVRDSIVGLWKSDQNTNESPTRNIIKNTIKGKGGDLELLNFGYKLNSGYGGYIEDFSLFTLSNRFEYSEISNTKVTITAVLDNSTGIYHSVTEEDSALYWNTFKIKVSGSTDDVYISYTTAKKNIRLYNGINTVVVPNELSWHSFLASKANTSCNITLEFVPLYEGALVTDGKDDIIVSQKTVQEMLGGSNVCTVVSMIHQINLSADVNTSINNIRSESVAHVCARHLNTAYGKTGIFGYSKQLNTTSNPTLINNILGDKNDYIADGNSVIDTTDKYFVQGYKYNDSLYELSEVAVYWTFISNKVLTTDEINQIIAYFKLDKYVTPQVIYYVKRQGLTNDTPDADWYLKDFSGNGHDMQLYNYAKKLSSGIGKYEVDFNTWIPQSYVADSAYTSNKLHITNIKGGNAILYTKKGANAMKVKITGIQSFNLVYRYIAENDVWEALEVDRDGIYELPASTTTTKTYYTGFTVPYYTGDCDITIEQIPDYEGALVSDGKDDYGYADNLPIFKDYTVAIDRAWINLVGARTECLSTKNSDPDWGAFNFELSESIGRSTFSFGNTNQVSIDVDRKISYQSKYSYNGAAIAAGNIVDGKDLFLFRSRSAFPYYAEAAIWSYLLFPYSLSEFLIERQLKRYKLGTLYPDMVEFRPIIKNNNQYRRIDFYTQSWDKKIYPGDYVPINSILRANIYLNNELNELQSFRINGVNVTFAKSSVDKTAYNIGNIPIAKSPQKIDITIDEYIRFEDIVQPYPAIINLSQDGKSITWGDKLKVGSEVTFVNHTNILPDLYTIGGGVQYNGTFIFWNTSIRVEKSMVFVNPHSYKKANEPNCILSPQTLRIPNSSYKILRYIPDLTGKGNHGRLNNFAYTEESGANEDGSIRFDGTDDHIIIPTIKHGGKALLMKVNWRYKNNIAMVYDQRINWGGLGISISRDQLPFVAYKPYNKVTYIDGIKNESVLVQDLEGITHNITGIYDNLDLSDNRDVCISRTSDDSNSGFADMSMYEFMLFPDVPDEEEIKELNDIIGIEGGYVESPNYYWDSFGKKNTDTDRNLIADQVSKDVANALEVKNVAYNSESGYGYGKSNFISIMESSQQFVDIIDDYNFIIKATPHNNNQFFAQVNTPKLIPNNYIRFKVSGIPEDFKMVFGYDYVEGGTNEYSHIIDKNGVYSYDSFNVFYTSFRAYTGYTDLTGLNIKVEFLDYHPNGLLLDGVEDHAVNTVIPAVTDFTVIAKRTDLRIIDDLTSSFIQKGLSAVWNVGGAFSEGRTEADKQYCSTFGNSNDISNVYNKEFFYETKNSYNGKAITIRTDKTDSNGLSIGAIMNNGSALGGYWKGIFYKLMFYTKTIDQLSINMLKNLFERDELIDITNPIFKKKEL